MELLGGGRGGSSRYILLYLITKVLLLQLTRADFARFRIRCSQGKRKVGDLNSIVQHGT